MVEWPRTAEAQQYFSYNVCTATTIVRQDHFSSINFKRNQK